MKYKVQGMDSKNYHLMMCGYRGYIVKNFWIEANSKTEAYTIIKNKYPDLVINDYIESEEEVKQQEEEYKKKEEEEKRKEKEKEEKKRIKEEEKAKSLNLTIEEYKEYKRLERNKKRHESNLRKCYTTIEKMNNQIEYEEKKIEEYQNAMKKAIDKSIRV